MYLSAETRNWTLDRLREKLCLAGVSGPTETSNTGSASMKPQVAFIGLGVMGHRMLTNMGAHGGFSLVGGWDPSPVARERTRAAFPDLALVEDPEIGRASGTDRV